MSDGSEVSVRPLEEADWEECVDFGVEAFAAIPPSVKTLEEVSAACAPASSLSSETLARPCGHNDAVTGRVAAGAQQGVGGA